MENKNKSCLPTDIEVGNLQEEDETKPFYENSLTAREMESLVAICDTLIPSIDDDASGVGHVVDDGVARYYSASASQTGTPDRVARLMCERLNHPKKWILRVALWLLSTCIGSLILCGRRSFSGGFPYFRRFCKLPKKQREEILLNWSSSYFLLLRMFFRSMKLITAFVFFTQVDEKGNNLAWKAIGYDGPSSDNSDYEEELEKKKKKPEEIFGPLYNGILDLKSPRDSVEKKLTGCGFTFSTQNMSKNRSSISNPVMTIGCDAVVVGSGSGGGVVAGVLAKAGYKVIVVEKGSYYARSKLSLLEGEAMDEMYLSGGLLATSDMNVVILAGSTVGGGSTINWSASIKTPEHVMKEWAEELKLEMFGNDLYREAMDVVCERMGVQCGFVEEGFNNEILRKGCEVLGLPVRDIPRNSPSDHYCGFCSLGCKKGQKQGTGETWLVDLVESGNGLILPGCEVMKVLYECELGKKKKKKNMATGIAFAFGKEIYVVESKATVVACGALRTPHLLKRSGLKNSNIGRNLCLHPVVMAWGWFPEEDKWPEKKKKSYEGGIMTAMSSIANTETQRSYGETVIQTPSLHPGMFSGIIPWTSSKEFKTRMLKFSRTAHVFTLLRDKGTGRIDSKSFIDYNLNNEDEESLKKGLERVLKILVAAGAEEIGTHNSEGKSLDIRRASELDIERFVREESSKRLKDLSGQICSAHQMGSCRMGIRPEDSAVRPTGETWEVEGLFVADTSVFPTALGVNPMVTVQSIAYCIGLNVIDVLKRKKY